MSHLSHPQEALPTLKAWFEEIYLPLVDEEFARDAILHFIQYATMDET